MGSSDKPGFREEFLLELLRWKGRGENTIFEACPQGLMVCERCCLRNHASLPLHVIQKWEGERFVKIAMRDLGLRLQLVMDTDGLHEVDVNYCACDRRGGANRRQQLLRFGWYPASLKISGYDFYKSLAHMTDAMGLKVPKTKYKCFLRVVRQFRHLKMMMCAGRGQEEDGVKKTCEGGLALRCPACPIPGVNLPNGWMGCMPEKRYIYRGLFALDANFRLKNLHRSNSDVDPGLHTGLAYMVKYAPYLVHVKKFASQKDISTCSGFKTLAHAETKGEAGLRASGVGMCVCARHEMVCATGVGDLQKGERYANMDYIFLSAVSQLQLGDLFLSYDIACQWCINFNTRMKSDLPTHLRLRGGVGLSAGVPKLHAKAHKMSCQAEHAIGIQDGTGRTDGEGIERTWAVVNALAASTKEMGPGSRHDTLDDHFSYHNFLKLIGFGHLLHRKLAEAEIQVAAHQKYHADFTNALPDPSYVAEWTELVCNWEQDRSKPTPYLSTEEHTTEADLKLKLKEDERKSKENGELPIHEISATSCLALGLLIEESQRRLSGKTTGEGEMTWAQSADIEQRQSTLRRQMEQYRELQMVYMPGVALRHERAVAQATEEIQPEDERLWFPSDLSSSVRKVSCLAGLPKKEELLREAQCWDALASIRSSLRAEAAVLDFRNRTARGQSTLTRVADIMEGWKGKRDAAVEKYRNARKALLSLRGPGDWTEKLRELKDADMSSMYGAVLDGKEVRSEAVVSRRKKKQKIQADSTKDMPKDVSWIWLSEGSLANCDENSSIEDVRIHWIRSRAWLRRWEEERELLREEQRRILVMLQYRADWWESRKSGWSGIGRDIAEGIQAYALQQADAHRRLAHNFSATWQTAFTPPPDNDYESDDDDVVEP
ncbi:hypothetical protein ARMSODRAFT_991128 [Armillaria solidipes]|uniref:CxC2-like cysteine cluster KDZ transposase-associated domain-containing protein n=1 Tax=Armillaria solidipes TaxID=1076256 RepID=A0A2H3AKX8_9AGAR|nr:hypothetical protein ARMSODRAFT_991128 [Armillaria solidipes]